MPRPPDTYTHSQFEPVPSSNKDQLVVCSHCRSWTRNAKQLSAKKEHLRSCQEYIAWRAEGNGQDIAPQNPYHSLASGVARKTDPSVVYQSPYQDETGRNGSPDLKKAFHEFQDETSPTKCNKVRCLHCGFVRAKNTTRQVEHLLQCKDYLDSPDGQPALVAGLLATDDDTPTLPMGQREIWRGQKPNPNLTVNRRAPNKRRRDGSAVHSSGESAMGSSFSPTTSKPAPSLTNHLLNRDPSSFRAATEQNFLSEAGCGTLSTRPLSQWLAQNGHISRAFISFIGTLIGKIRLPDVKNTQFNPTYRTLDLLISALNNVRREMSFFEIESVKYGLQVPVEDPKPITKAYLDLFASAAGPGGSLLEGMVVLWATEHCYRVSYHYASTFTSTASSSSYSLPSYLTQTPGSATRGTPSGNNPYQNPYDSSNSDNQKHIAALHHALIPNYTSPAFGKFVDACKAMVDELANAQTSGNGREEMMRCQNVFTQVVYLWERVWPEVDGMGEEDEEAEVRNSRTSPTASRAKPTANGAGKENGNTTEKQIEVAEDADADADGDAAGEVDDDPYDGTGLGAVHAATQAV